MGLHGLNTALDCEMAKRVVCVLSTVGSAASLSAWYAASASTP
jgi:hypothetical protein